MISVIPMGTIIILSPRLKHSGVNCAKGLNKINSIRDSSATSQNGLNALGPQIVREIVILALTKEVNEGKNFAQLRQVCYFVNSGEAADKKIVISKEVKEKTLSVSTETQLRTNLEGIIAASHFVKIVELKNDDNKKIPWYVNFKTPYTDNPGMGLQNFLAKDAVQLEKMKDIEVYYLLIGEEGKNPQLPECRSIRPSNCECRSIRPFAGMAAWIIKKFLYKEN